MGLKRTSPGFWRHWGGESLWGACKGDTQVGVHQCGDRGLIRHSGCSSNHGPGSYLDRRVRIACRCCVCKDEKREACSKYTNQRRHDRIEGRLPAWSSTTEFEVLLLAEAGIAEPHRDHIYVCPPRKTGILAKKLCATLSASANVIAPGRNLDKTWRVRGVKSRCPVDVYPHPTDRHENRLLDESASTLHPPAMVAEDEASRACQTCRIRHVKCDRTRPECRQCLHAGRGCDGYAVQHKPKKRQFTFKVAQWSPRPRSPKSHPPSPKPKRLSLSSASSSSSPPPPSRRKDAIVAVTSSKPLEFAPFSCLSSTPMSFFVDGEPFTMKALEYFWLRTVPSMSGPFHDDNWVQPLVRFSTTLRPVFHACAAVSMFHRLSHAALRAPDDPDETTLRDQALRHYVAGLRETQVIVHTGAMSRFPMKVLCILFTLAESLQGHRASARSHFTSSLALQNVVVAGDLRSVPTKEERSLDAALFHIGIAQTTYGRPRGAPFPSITLPPETARQAEGDCILSARDSLFTIVASILALVREQYFLRLGLFPETAPFCTTPQEARDRLANWLSTNDTLLRDPKYTSPAGHFASNILLAHYHTSSLFLETMNTSTQTVFDDHTPRFNAILAQLTPLLSGTPPASNPISLTDTGTIALLFLTATKCRHPRVRRHAVSLMHHAPEREGMWDRTQAAIVASAVIRQEERLLDLAGQRVLEKTWSSMMVNARRVRDVDIVDLQGAGIKAVLRGTDGTVVREVVVARRPLPQRDQLLGARGMYGDAAVKVGLCGAHLDGDAKALQHLAAALAHDVQPDDLLLLARAHQLVRAGALVLGLHHRIVHRGEAGGVDLDIVLAEFLLGLRLREADGADLGVREHDGRDVVIDEVRVLRAAEDAVRELATRGDGDGGELVALVADVTEREDAGHVGLLVVVDGDVAALVLLDAGLVEAQVLNLGRAADGPQQGVDVEGAGAAVVLVVDALLAVAEVLDLLLRGLLVQVDAAALVLGCDLFLDHGVEGAQEGVVANEEVGLGAESVEHARHLDGDVACADEGGLLGLRLELKEAIGRDAKICTRNVGGDVGVSAHSDQDVLGLDGLLAAVVERDGDGVGIEKGGTAVDVFDLVLVQVALVDAVQSANISVTLLDEFRPVKGRGLLDREAVSLCGVDCLPDRSGIPGDLLRHTANVDASATQAVGFNGNGLRTIAGGTPSRCQSAGATADDQIVALLRDGCHDWRGAHEWGLRRTGWRYLRDDKGEGGGANCMHTRFTHGSVEVHDDVIPSCWSSQDCIKAASTSHAVSHHSRVFETLTNTMGGRVSVPRGPGGLVEAPNSTPRRPVRNTRQYALPLAAITLGTIIFVYTRTTVAAAKENARRAREADGGKINWRNENARRHGALKKAEDRTLWGQLTGREADGQTEIDQARAAAKEVEVTNPIEEGIRKARDGRKSE
ncbi:hypothetical protein FH972_025869 [Carpinus fangiana]|uniref:Zn(2)-C6 fungal-type domain-containing protein n=1 Tax=Carpinus fangiana TaxID=176857 RepID=A0A5N6L2N8_9ROSI|nr:hypothetical protein FH972_025869 [Carpinus fangiana]